MAWAYNGQSYHLLEACLLLASWASYVMPPVPAPAVPGGPSSHRGLAWVGAELRFQKEEGPWLWEPWRLGEKGVFRAVPQGGRDRE